MDNQLKISLNHQVHLRSVLLSLQQANLLSVHTVSSTLNISAAHCRELSAKSVNDGVQVIAPITLDSLISIERQKKQFIDNMNPLIRQATRQQCADPCSGVREEVNFSFWEAMESGDIVPQPGTALPFLNLLALLGNGRRSGRFARGF